MTLSETNGFVNDTSSNCIGNDKIASASKTIKRDIFVDGNAVNVSHVNDALRDRGPVS